MTVQELFRKADMEKVWDAYLLMHPIFQKHKKASVREKMQVLEKTRSAVRETCTYIQTCAPVCLREQETVFVMELDIEYWEQKGEKEFIGFAVKDREARRKSGDAASVWNTKEEGTGYWGIGAAAPQKLAAYKVSRGSVRQYGAEVCCAQILYELFSFGFSEAEREKNIIKLKDTLRESISNLESGKEAAAADFFEEIHKCMVAACRDEDERQYMIYEYEFNASVKAIKDRYVRKVLWKNQQAVIEAVKKEFALCVKK